MKIIHYQRARNMKTRCHPWTGLVIGSHALQASVSTYIGSRPVVLACLQYYAVKMMNPLAVSRTARAFLVDII